MEAKTMKLRIVMFPWLAMGHQIPFFRLSKILAKMGHEIFFVSTPRNLNRLPKLPSNLSSLVTLVSLPLPQVPNLPPHAESSTDVPYVMQQLLKQALDLLQQPINDFLESVDPKPDWILFDYASHWLPPLAAKLGISSSFFSLFTAACLSFIGPPLGLMSGGDPRMTAEDFAVVPKWIPFESNIVYHPHELTKYVEKTVQDPNPSGPSDSVRFGFAAGGCDLVIVRSSPELEPEWFRLLEDELYQKPIVPLGFLPPSTEDIEDDNFDEWRNMKEWLDKQDLKSVVYVALGTEAALAQEELRELALGLEKSMLPFFWVLKNPPGSTQNAVEMLPEGFQDRVQNRGFIFVGWTPQVKILSHESVNGFLTHCGWNSVIEGLSLDKVLILLPMLNDQGLNARLLSVKNLGKEIPRNRQDGSFSSESVAEVVRKTMAENSGMSSSTALRSLFGDTDRNNQHVERLVQHLEENSKTRLARARRD